MRLLDRYILRSLVTPWVSCLLGISFLLVISDLFENVNHFMDAGSGLFSVLGYYLLFLPSIWIYVGPITLLFGCLGALYVLTRNNEITAMRASGVSLYRVLVPFIVVGVVLSLLSIPVYQTFAPRSQAWTEATMLRIKTREQDQASDLVFNLRYRDPTANRTWEIGTINRRTYEMKNVTLTQRRPNNKIDYVVKTSTANWLDGQWVFHDLELQPHTEAGYRKGEPEHHAVRMMMNIDETPQRILREVKNFEWMSSHELRRYLADRPSISARTRDDLHTQLRIRQAHPWMCLVVVFLSVPFGTHTARKGIFKGMALCLGLFFFLFFAISVSKALGQGGLIPAFWAGWSPILIFGATGAWLLYRLR